jgi:hypothetical protein
MKLSGGENYPLLGYNAASSGDFLPTFRDKLSGPTDCPETLVVNYHYSLRNDPEVHNFRLLRGGILKSRLVVEGTKNRKAIQGKHL